MRAIDRLTPACCGRECEGEQRLARGRSVPSRKASDNPSPEGVQTYSSPVRTPRGRDILAACGQLKSETEKLSVREREALRAMAMTD